MTIRFYLDDGLDTEITTMYDMQSNPFNVGDIINLDVDELYPIEYKKYKEAFRKSLMEDNDKLMSKFRRKKIRLERVSKYMSFKIITETKLVIEYYCKIID